MKNNKYTLEKLAELSEQHPYYCSESSYYGLGFSTEYDTWGQFIAEMGDSDHDMNLVFRWDVNKADDGSYYANIYIVHQRKGRFIPQTIHEILESDVDSFIKFITERKITIDKLWNI